MSELAAAPAAEAPVAAPPVATPPAIEREWTPSEAARFLAQRRNEKRQQAEAAPPAAAPEPAQELPPQGNAAPPQEVTGETQEADPAELPPLELPRSWTKEQAEYWNSLPRQTQEYLSERASKDSEAVRRSQNEAAEIRKAAEATQKAAEEARQKYEAQLPALMQALQDANAGSFGDIRSVDDVTRLAQEDPFRYLQWQAHQQKLAAVQAEMQRAEGEKTTKKQAERNDYLAKQNKLLVELIPEMADEKKSVEIRDKAVAMLEDDLGFSRDQLQRWMQTDAGFEILSDARMQKLIFDRMSLKGQLSGIEKAKATIAAKPLPPVQRPGVGKPAQSPNSARIQALEQQLDNTTGVNQAKIMAEIRQLRKGAR